MTRHVARYGVNSGDSFIIFSIVTISKCIISNTKILITHLPKEYKKNQKWNQADDVLKNVCKKCLMIWNHCNIYNNTLALVFHSLISGWIGFFLTHFFSLSGVDFCNFNFSPCCGDVCLLNVRWFGNFLNLVKKFISFSWDVWLGIYCFLLFYFFKPKNICTFFIMKLIFLELKIKQDP